jgi:F-type H+-transporting ATPase subunit gamma
MPSIKDLKKRITSTKNTQQTTRAMKMVSAAKLRRAQEAITHHRPFAKKILGLIKEVSLLADGSETSPLIYREHGGERKRLLLVLVTSDRGLCGGFNSSVIKTTQRWMAANGAKYESITMGFVGRKAYEFFRTKGVKMGPYYQELGGKVTFAKARKLADGLKDLYLNDEFDEVKIVYNEFKNAVTQKVNVEDFLPLQAAPVEEAEAKAASSVGEEQKVYTVKPSVDEVLGQLLQKNFGIQAFRIMLDSQASEHGARMSAMENATKNAGEMIRKLTLQYNKQRQAGITKELLEIISGSESQKSSA